MAITDYDSLQAAVAQWLHRTDLGAVIPDFISLAESKLSSALDARAMEARVVLTAAGGASYLALPSDMLEMRRMVLQSDPTVTLKYATPDQISADYSHSMTGRPAVFAVIGSQAQLAPTPDSDYAIELTYQQRIPALSANNQTNWLITAFPNAYLYGALTAAQPFIANDARLDMFQKLYLEAVQGINSIDWYSGSTLRVRAR